MDVLLVQPGQLGGNDQLVLGLIHVHRWSPHALQSGHGTGATEEAVKEPIHLPLDVRYVSERIVGGVGKRPESNKRHNRLLFWAGAQVGITLSEGIFTSLNLSRNSKKFL